MGEPYLRLGWVSMGMNEAFRGELKPWHQGLVEMPPGSLRSAHLTKGERISDLHASAPARVAPEGSKAIAANHQGLVLNDSELERPIRAQTEAVECLWNHGTTRKSLNLGSAQQRSLEGVPSMAVPINLTVMVDLSSLLNQHLLVSSRASSGVSADTMLEFSLSRETIAANVTK